MKTEIKNTETNIEIYKFKTVKLELYDRIYIRELTNTPYNLYGISYNSDNFFSKEYWNPIEKSEIDNYNIVIERSITDFRVFVILKI